MPILTPIGSDNFTRPDENPLSQSGNWTQLTHGDDTLQLVSDVAELQVVNLQHLSLYSGVSLPNNQYASATVVNAIVANSTAFIMSRYVDQGESPQNNAGYFLEVSPGGNYGVFTLNTTLMTGTITAAAGDTYTLAIVGTTVYFLQNGNIINSTTDATYASGEGALGGFSNNAITRVQYSNWVVGSAALATYSISGNAGVAGATVSWSGTSTGSTTADGSGNYTISGLSSGSYTVTPSKSGYTFSPTSQNETITSSNITNVNFTATPVSSTPGPTATLNSKNTYKPRAVQIFGSMNGEIVGVSVDSNGNLAVASSGNVNTIDVLGNLSEAVVCVIAGPTSGVTAPGAQAGLVFAAVDTYGNLIASDSAISGSPNTTVDLLVDQGVVSVQIFGRLSSTGQLIGVCANSQGGLGTTLNPLSGVTPGGPAGIDTLYPDDGQWPIPILLCGRVVAGYSNSGKIVPVSLTVAGGLAISGAADASTTVPTVSFNNSVASPIQLYARTSANALTSVPLNSLGQLLFN